MIINLCCDFATMRLIMLGDFPPNPQSLTHSISEAILWPRKYWFATLKNIRAYPVYYKALTFASEAYYSAQVALQQCLVLYNGQRLISVYQNCKNGGEKS
jgi:hypothetical protein